ncbi:MAG TPA: ectonucleotide pyrophosphatase/phosphodiesterase [Chryseosolibacter sp.]
MRIAAFLLYLLVYTSSFAQKNPADQYVLLVSFDGFRYDYAERFNLPNFKKFIREGAAADGLIPSFPSKTFPNHYTIVTGLYPGNHGLVDNGFYDPDQEKLYSMRNREVVTDSSFYGGIPLWQLAKQNGIKSASYFWVGSELKQENLHPDYFFEYNQSVPFEQRVDKIMEWLSLPEEDRPRMITLYFSSPDFESHRYGPLAPETKAKVFEMDSLLGMLMRKIDDTKLPVNMVLVSDHGMKELVDKTETYISLDDHVTTKGNIRVVNGGTQAHLYTGSSAQTDSLAAALKKVAKDFTVVRRSEFPAAWHYNNPRSGDILVIANPGKYIVTGNKESHLREANRGGTFGVHGYDPAKVKDMQGIFYARGPRVKAGKRIAAFQNIHIYPFIAMMMDIKLPPIDGNENVLRPILKD